MKYRLIIPYNEDMSHISTDGLIHRIEAGTHYYEEFMHHTQPSENEVYGFQVCYRTLTHGGGYLELLELLPLNVIAGPLWKPSSSLPCQVKYLERAKDLVLSHRAFPKQAYLVLEGGLLLHPPYQELHLENSVKDHIYQLKGLDDVQKREAYVQLYEAVRYYYEYLDFRMPKKELQAKTPATNVVSYLAQPLRTKKYI